MQSFAAALALAIGPSTSRNSGRLDCGVSLSEIVGAKPSNNCGCAERMPAQRARSAWIETAEPISTPYSIGSGKAGATTAAIAAGVAGTGGPLSGHGGAALLWPGARSSR